MQFGETPRHSREEFFVVVPLSCWLSAMRAHAQITAELGSVPHLFKSDLILGWKRVHGSLLVACCSCPCRSLTRTDLPSLPPP